MVGRMREKPSPGTSVLDELVFVGRSGRAGPADVRPAGPLAMPVLAERDLDGPGPTARQRVAGFAILTLVAAVAILIIGLAIGYAG